MAKVPELADRAFEDQCTAANPKLPLVKELEAKPLIYLALKSVLLKPVRNNQ